MSEIGIFRQLTTRTVWTPPRLGCNIAKSRAARGFSFSFGRESSFAMNRRQRPCFAFRQLSLCMVFVALSVAASAASKEKVLYSFRGGTDGFQPAGGVVIDRSGNLYGATSWGRYDLSFAGLRSRFRGLPAQHEGRRVDGDRNLRIQRSSRRSWRWAHSRRRPDYRSAGEFVRDHQFGRQRSLHFAGIACGLRHGVQIVPARQEGTAMDRDNSLQLPGRNRRLLSVGRFGV